MINRPNDDDDDNNNNNNNNNNNLIADIHCIFRRRIQETGIRLAQRPLDAGLVKPLGFLAVAVMSSYDE